MAKTKTGSWRVPAQSPSLDHWVGPQQHMATGVSTDPAMRTPTSGPKKTRGEEPEVENS